jgi:phospholipase/lecithinase/hemolysin
VDETLVATHGLRYMSLKQQVNDVFQPFYAPDDQSTQFWRGDDTLIILWFGINDVLNYYSMASEVRAALTARIFAAYADLVGQIYQAGARNFVFMNVPPVHRSPLMIRMGTGARELLRRAILDFNRGIDFLAKNTTVADTAAWLVDTWGPFEQALDNPSIFEATKGYKNVTSCCDSYS